MKAGRIGSVATLALFAIAGCGIRTKTVDVNSRISQPATCVDAVEVYNSRAEVPYDYYELAWISAEGNSVWTTDAKMRSVIIQNAAKVGANGIIVNPVSQDKQGVKVLGEALGAQSATAKSSALAIYMPADAGRVTLKCGAAR